jgi:protein tyrosine/serine phosphatase
VLDERRLFWDGCLNVRDLGGHPTEDGGLTRFRAIVRADNIRQLTETGWEQLADYGIRSIVDLRQHSERTEDPPIGVPVAVTSVSLLPDDIPPEAEVELARTWRAAPDAVTATRDAYLDILEGFRANVALAVSVVGCAPEGGVLVHCMGGKDRTGLVSALLLRLAGVPVADIAQEYSLSAENLAPWLSKWVEAAEDKDEREFRRRMSGSPAASLEQVLGELERRYGSVEAYLRDAGVSDADLARARERLRDSSSEQARTR